MYINSIDNYCSTIFFDLFAYNIFIEWNVKVLDDCRLQFSHVFVQVGLEVLNSTKQKNKIKFIIGTFYGENYH